MHPQKRRRMLVPVVCSLAPLALIASAFNAAPPPEQPARTLSVADFETIGHVSIAEAGKSVAALLLPEFQTRFQLVERQQLARLLEEHDLAMADIVRNPALLPSRGPLGLDYLVLGDVVGIKPLTISARLVDVSTGKISQTGEVTLTDERMLRAALSELAGVLMMTHEEKERYYDKERVPVLIGDAERARRTGEYDRAILVYRRVLRVAFDEKTEVELLKTEMERMASIVDVQMQGLACGSEIDQNCARPDRPILLLLEDGKITGLILRDGPLFDPENRSAVREYIAKHDFCLMLGFDEGLSPQTRFSRVFDSFLMGRGIGICVFKEHDEGGKVVLEEFDEVKGVIRLTARLAIAAFTGEYSENAVDSPMKLKECTHGELRLEVKGRFVGVDEGELFGRH